MYKQFNPKRKASFSTIHYHLVKPSCNSYCIFSSSQCFKWKERPNELFTFLFYHIVHIFVQNTFLILLYQEYMQPSADYSVDLILATTESENILNYVEAGKVRWTSITPFILLVEGVLYGQRGNSSFSMKRAARYLPYQSNKPYCVLMKWIRYRLLFATIKATVYWPMRDRHPGTMEVWCGHGQWFWLVRYGKILRFENVWLVSGLTYPTCNVLELVTKHYSFSFLEITFSELFTLFSVLKISLNH